MQLSPADSGKFIARHAKHVKIHESGILKLVDEVMTKLESGEIKMNLITKHECYPQGMPDEKIADWVLSIDALNYCFWTPGKCKWKISYKQKNYSGYFALCAAIARAMEEGIDLTDPKVYSNLTMSDVKNIFKSASSKEIPLIEKRLDCWQEVGKVLIEKYNGSFVNCIKAANKSAVSLLNIITSEFKCFDDTATFCGKIVSLHKRAQIVVADIWSMFRGKGLGEFHDIDKITMFADYRVPQVLVHFGALSYSDELMKTLKSDKILENGSDLEVEIRGCSIEAVERTMEEVNKIIITSGKNYLCNSILVDNYLWMYRRDHSEELEYIPFHKTVSIYY